MADKISALPAAASLDGSELVPVVQGGITSKTTAAALAGCPGPGGGSLQNVCHLELVNRNTDFPLQTIFTPPKAGNYIFLIAGIDWAGSGGITFTMTGGKLGGQTLTGNAVLPAPNDTPEFWEQAATRLPRRHHSGANFDHKLKPCLSDGAKIFVLHGHREARVTHPPCSSIRRPGACQRCNSCNATRG